MTVLVRVAVPVPAKERIEIIVDDATRCCIIIQYMHKIGEGVLDNGCLVSIYLQPRL